MSKLYVDGKQVVDIGDTVKGNNYTMTSLSTGWTNNLSYPITLSKGTYVVTGIIWSLSTGNAGSYVVRLHDTVTSIDFICGYSQSMATLGVNGVDVIKLTSDVTSLSMDIYCQVSSGNTNIRMCFIKID